LVAVIVFERLPRLAMNICSACLLFYAGLTLAQNYSRPIFSTAFWSLPRERQYFTPPDDPVMINALAPMVDTIVALEPRSIGLKSSCCSFEYAIWIMLKNRGYRGRIDRCYVENVSATIPTSIPTPEVIISEYEQTPPAVSKDYPHVQKFGRFKLLSVEKLAAATH
jgi:hypothetical protein